MPTESTAVLTMGTVEPFFSGEVRRITHVLVLNEGSRAVWTVSDLSGRRQPGTVRPRAPRHLLFHGLLGWLASIPQGARVIASRPELSGQVFDSVDGESLETEVDSEDMRSIVQALPENTFAVLTLIDGATIQPAEVAAAGDLGLRIELAMSPAGRGRQANGRLGGEASSELEVR